MADAILALNRATWHWVRTHGSEGGAAHRFRMGWNALWGDLNWWLSRQIVAHSAVRSVEDPVLIVGPWRSGTTVMHELLSAATGLATPRSWQCMNAASFVLTGPPRTRSSVSRPMDRLVVHSESPQEDEFALLALGAPTAYRAFLAPRQLSALLPTLDQDHWLADEHWCRTWVAFLQATLASAPMSRQPLLLKSPNHTYRMLAILRRFPRARFIWMARDPVEVFHSNRKMWNAMARHYASIEPDSQMLDGFLTKALLAAAQAADQCRQALPREQFTLVRLDDLRASPASTVSAVSQQLRLSLQPECLEQVTASIASDVKETYSGALPPAALDAAARLRDAHARAFKSHGAS